MTADGLAGEGDGPDPGAALAVCDAVLGEVGRRSHLFGWLRDPESGPQHWIPVDAYYPAHRLVVVCRRPEDPHARLYDELVPAHGLRLLVLDPDELAADEDGPQALIEDLLSELGDLRPPPPAEPDERPRENPVLRAMATFTQPLVPATPHEPPVGQRAAAAERAARFVASRHPAPPGRAARAPTVPRPRTPPRPHGPPPPLQAPSVLVGLALAAALCIEIYVGVVGLVLGGHLLLAFGLALDCAARALGTIAAARTGRQDWVWLCLIGGSPAVATFALFHPSGPVDLEPAPLAGLLALLAGAVIVVVLLGGALGL